MAIFAVKQSSCYDCGKIAYEKPIEIGQFSKLEDGTIRLDKTELKLYEPAPLESSNLLDGFESYSELEQDIYHPAPMEPISKVLESLSPSISTHVVSFRNNLNKILQTPYNEKNDWTMNVDKRQDCLYLDVQLTDDAKVSRPVRNSYQSKCCYAGRRFETISTVQASSVGAEYCGVFQCKLGDLKLILAAEIDCQIEDEYVELKTFRVLSNSKDQYVFERFKLLAFWIQSYLVGIPTIICGFRDAAFTLVKRQKFQTKDLPGYGKKYWTPRVCLNFAHQLLTWIIAHTENDISYHLTYCARERRIHLTHSNGKIKKRRPVEV